MQKHHHNTYTNLIGSWKKKFDLKKGVVFIQKYKLQIRLAQFQQKCTKSYTNLEISLEAVVTFWEVIEVY